jgi:ribonuclease P/MRP protein subunit RPP1
MPYFDLNVPVPADAKLAKAFVDTAVQLGYDAIAFNHVVNRKLTPADACSIKFPALPTALQQQAACLRLPCDQPRFRQYTRITVAMEDAAQVHTLNPTNPILRSYDIFAVRPTSEKAFQAACLTLEGVDIISLDLSTRLPFQLKRPYIFGALARGVSFEISYGSALRGAFVCAMRRIVFYF